MRRLARSTLAVLGTLLAGHVFTVSRRPGVELTRPNLDAGDTASSLDVPASLRRQS